MARDGECLRQTSIRLSIGIVLSGCARQVATQLDSRFYQRLKWARARHSQDFRDWPKLSIAVSGLAHAGTACCRRKLPFISRCGIASVRLSPARSFADSRRPRTAHSLGAFRLGRDIGRRAACALATSLPSAALLGAPTWHRARRAQQTPPPPKLPSLAHGSQQIYLRMPSTSSSGERVPPGSVTRRAYEMWAIEWGKRR